MRPNSINRSVKFVTSLNTRLITSIIVGCLFGFFHFLLSNNEISIFFYYAISNFLLSLGIWQVADFVFKLTERSYSWFEKPFQRIIVSLIYGTVLTYVVVFIADFILPYLMDPIFEIDSENLPEQPEMSVAVFFLDGIISIFIFLFYLTFLNLFNYFSQVQEQRVKDAEKTIENYFGTLIENIHDVIQVMNIEGRITYCSSSIFRLSEYTVEEAMKFDGISSLVHQDDREDLANELKSNIENKNASFITRFRSMSKSGRIKQIEAKFIDAIENPLLNGYIVILSDITETVNSEIKIKHQNDLYQLLTEISTEFLNKDLEHSAKIMLERIGIFAAVDRAYIYLLDEDHVKWNCLYEWRSLNVESIPSNYYQTGIFTEQSRWLYENLLKGELINVEDVEDLTPEASDFKELCNADKTRSVLLIPLYRNGKTFGFMGYDSVIRKKHWEEDDISALQICSEILVSSILRSEAESAMARSLSINKAIVESTSEGILLTDLNDNILYYNQNFKEMWMFKDSELVEKKKSVALNHAIKRVINADEIYEIISSSEENINQRIRLVAFLKNNRVLEGISQPQIIDGEVVGRIWSNRDITERVHAEKEELEKGFAQAQFESLKNQVNPHFLFNSLNVLSSLVHIDADLSEKFIDQLARSYRYLLEQRDNELVSLKTELDFVNSFAFLLKIRFEEKLKIEINVDENTKQKYVAPLTLQLLIENAVKHNIISSESPLIIEISNDDKGYLIIKNNLQLRDQQLPSTGVGLNNIRERYKILTNQKTEFYIDNKDYIAKIPLINK